MAKTPATNRIAERKLRDKQARRAQIISAARRIAELEGWSNVTVRRNSLLEGSGQIDVHAEHGMSTSLPATLGYFFTVLATESLPTTRSKLVIAG